LKLLFIYTVFNREGHRVAKYSDIGAAFAAAVKPDPKRGFTVTTVDFVQQLEARHHHWPLEQANRWIARYQTYFRDYTPHEGEDRCYFMIGMGRIM